LENIRVRRLSQIKLGACNALTEGCWLWPIEAEQNSYRIVKGEHNYFNHGVMTDPFGRIESGSHNVCGSVVYRIDSEWSKFAN
jgi:hypothetical protein